MNSKRVYILLLGVIGILLLGIIAGTYGINSLLQSKSTALVNLKLKDQVLSGQQVGLIKAKKDVAAYAGLNQIAKTIVPQDKDQAQAVLEISKLAKDSGIGQLSSISFPASTLGGLANGSAPSTTTPAPVNSAGNNLTQLTPVVGISGVYQLQITISQSNDNPVPYSQFTDFLTRLEQNRRTAQVSSITLTPDTRNLNTVAFTLIINEFIKP